MKYKWLRLKFCIRKQNYLIPLCKKFINYYRYIGWMKFKFMCIIVWINISLWHNCYKIILEIWVNFKIYFFGAITSTENQIIYVYKMKMFTNWILNYKKIFFISNCLYYFMTSIFTIRLDLNFFNDFFFFMNFC